MSTAALADPENSGAPPPPPSCVGGPGSKVGQVTGQLLKRVTCSWTKSKKRLPEVRHETLCIFDPVVRAAPSFDPRFREESL